MISTKEEDAFQRGYDQGVAFNETMTAVWRHHASVAQAENRRYRKGIQDYLAGNYGRELGKIDQCSHGFYGYQGCAKCVDEHFEQLLNGEASSVSDDRSDSDASSVAR